jgi:GxxExxY protein
MNADCPTQPKAPRERVVLLEEQLTRRILRVFYDVYNELGPGFLESVYAGALQVAFDQCGLRAQREHPLDVLFRGIRVGEFRADFVVESRIILELKVARALTASHAGQLLNYLRASRIEVGLLLNFGLEPQFRRLVSDNRWKQSAIIRGDPR